MYYMATRKSTLKNIVSGCVVHSEHRIDTLNARSIGKEHLKVFITVIYRKDCFFLGFSKNVYKEATEVFYEKSCS